MYLKNKLFILVLVFVMLAMACSNIGNKENSQSQNSPIDSIAIENLKFNIIIINYYFGREQQITTVTQDSLKSEFKMTDADQKINLRALTPKESKKLRKFLAGFPLKELKKDYVYGGVKDGTVIDFSITVNQLKKDIHVANLFQKDLGALVEHIVSLLEFDYIGYNLIAVPEKE